MSFRFFTNAVAQASKNFAAGLFVTGLLLIGFGVMILVFSEIFAFLAAVVFSVAGLSCAVTAIKIFLVQRKLNKINPDDSQGYRENVHIHVEQYDEP